MIDDISEAFAAAAAQQQEAAQVVPVTEEIQKVDSISKVVKDSLANLQLSDLGSIVKGENTIIKDALSSLLDITVAFIPKLLGAILVLWVGLRLIKLLRRGLSKLLNKRNADPSLSSFLSSFVDMLLKVLLIIMAMDIIGIKATSFIAIIGAMGLAVGMALQGTLQNFAGGVILLLLRPFKVGDYIECGSYKGYVREIRIFHTIIRPFNGRTIIVPNSELATKSLINHTHEPIIRLDVVASVAYGTNLQKAKDVLMDVVRNEPLIIWEPKAPKIAVSNLGDNGVDLSMWLWTKTEDYWTVWEHIRENIYNALYLNGIEIPFPQIQLHTDGDSPSPTPTDEPYTSPSLEGQSPRPLPTKDEKAKEIA